MVCLLQVWGCACFDLVLTPFTGDDSRNHVSATVRITYTKAYPFEACVRGLASCAPYLWPDTCGNNHAYQAPR